MYIYLYIYGAYNIYIYIIHIYDSDGFSIAILDFQIFGDVSPVPTETRRLSMSSTRPAKLTGARSKGAIEISQSEAHSQPHSQQKCSSSELGKQYVV